MDGVTTSITALILVMVLKVYVTVSAGVCRSKKSMDGKTVIVTGANRGIGLEVARDLAKRKARVILACRDVAKGQQAAEDIRASVGTCDLVIRQLDLSSLRSVREFAKDVTDNEDRLDVLIHNAAFTPPQGTFLTEDNLELQFATNHFGPFLLTHLLLDLLKLSAPSRIIVTSSALHLLGALDFENLKFERYERNTFWVYCSTKLANVLFVRELSRRLEGTRVSANALHPGAVKTDIAINGGWFLRHVYTPIVHFFSRGPNSGAQTSIYLAVSEDVEGVSGKYFSECAESWTSPIAKNDELAKKLWNVSESLTRVAPPTVTQQAK